jgi:hypothetical protein
MMSAAQVLTFTAEFIDAGGCINCGVQIIMPRWFYEKRREDKANFTCINGHSQHFTGKSDTEKLREELEREKRYHGWTKEREASLRSSNDHLTHQLNGTKGALTKVRKRIAKGVCPACNRSFSDLASHMTCKHPGFGSNE